MVKRIDEDGGCGVDGAELRALREAAGLDQIEAARLLGYSKAHMFRLERGAGRDRRDVLRVIAVAMRGLAGMRVCAAHGLVLEREIRKLPARETARGGRRKDDPMEGWVTDLEDWLVGRK